MPVLIDGNNLLYAARDVEPHDWEVGRATLCARLAEWSRRRHTRVCIVFDGRPPNPRTQNEPSPHGVRTQREIPPPNAARPAASSGGARDLNARGPALTVQSSGPGLTVRFSGAGVTADSVLIDQIQRDSAPRRLIVVSTDREIARAAKRRAARPIRADEFWQRVLRDLGRPPRRQAEPPEKRTGLSADQAKGWAREFGFE